MTERDIYNIDPNIQLVELKSDEIDDNESLSARIYRGGGSIRGEVSYMQPEGLEARPDLLPDIKGTINAERIVIYPGARVDSNVLITGKEGPAKEVILGPFSYIGEYSKVLTPKFCIGDYSKLNARAFCHGSKPLQIGRNCWFGGDVVLDSMGGLDIEDGVGIGAHSHVWTHIQFGDIVEGSRFYSSQYVRIEPDVWLVGECKAHPARYGRMSMAMEGSVITRDMLPNHIYAGLPAKDVSDKMGLQFERRSGDQKAVKLVELITDFENKHPEYIGQLVVTTGGEQLYGNGKTCFNVSNRTYNRTLSPAEVVFLRSMTPLFKSTPIGSGNFYTYQEHIEPWYDPNEIEYQ